MTTLGKWSGDGLAAGPLTTASAGAGDTAPNGVPGTPGSIVAAGVRPPSIRHTQASGANCQTYWNHTPTSTVGFRFYWTPEATLTTNHTIARISAGTARQLDLNVTGTGLFRFYDSSNAMIAQSATGLISVGTRYRFEVALNAGMQAATVSLFDGDGATAVATITGAAGTYLATSDRVSVGNPTATPTNEQCLYDDVLWTDTATLPGPAVSVTDPPTVTVTAEQDSIGAGESTTITATASVASYSWATTAGTLTGSGATVTLTNPPSLTDRTATVTCTVTDDDGTTATDTATVTLVQAARKVWVGGAKTPAARRIITDAGPANWR